MKKLNRKILPAFVVCAAFLLSAASVSAHHQSILGGKNKIVIKHTADALGLPSAQGLTYEGNMWPSEVYELVTTAPPGQVVILDVRSPWERNGTMGGCPTRVAIGAPISGENSGVPIYKSVNPAGKDRGEYRIPLHVQTPIGIAFNAQDKDGNDLVGWPFRAVGYMIENPDFENYIAALEADGILKKDMVIITMCRSGFRSKYVADKLNDMGFTKVYSMLGGMLGWKNAGYKQCPTCTGDGSGPYPSDSNEANWIAWDPDKIYDPARLTNHGYPIHWTGSEYMAGGHAVIPEWFGDYAPPNTMVGFPGGPECKDGLAGFNGPWPRDNALTDYDVHPSLTRMAISGMDLSGWEGPTLADFGAPYPIVPGYFDEWPIEYGYYVEGDAIPVKGTDDPAGDFFTMYFGPEMYPPQDHVEPFVQPNRMYDCSYDPNCPTTTTTYCWAYPPPFGSGYMAMTVPAGKFWVPDLPWSIDHNYYAGP